MNQHLWFIQCHMLAWSRLLRASITYYCLSVKKLLRTNTTKIDLLSNQDASLFEFTDENIMSLNYKDKQPSL